MRATEDYDGLLERLEQAVADTRSMARTIALASVPPEHWDPAFRTPWVELLCARGRRGRGRRPQRAPRPSATTSTSWPKELAAHDLPEGFWPVAGALLVNLRNILASLDVVADAQPVSVPAPALSVRR